MTLTTKTGKGAKLTPAELDANWTEIENRIAALESGGTEGVGIASLSVNNNNQLMVTLTDNSTRGPFTLPTGKYAFKAEWQAEFNYIENDIISSDGSLYLVAYSHTSATTFDPGAGVNGNYYYRLIMTTPYSGSWQGELDYAATYRVGDTFKYTHNGIVSVYSVLIQHVTVAPFDPARQINGNNAYLLQFTFPDGAIGAGAYTGDFANYTAYTPGQWFRVSGDVYYTFYQVLTAHTSGNSFDPEADDGNGNDYYLKMFVALKGETIPNLSLTRAINFFFAQGSNIVADTVLGAVIATDPIHIPNTATGSVARCLTAPNQDATLDILYEGTVVGSVTFPYTSTTGTVSFSQHVFLAPGEYLSIKSRSSVAGLSVAVGLMVVVAAVYEP